MIIQHPGGNDNRHDEIDRSKARYNSRRLTTENLLIANKVIRCRFCKQEHYSDKCTTVTDWNARIEVVKNNKLCFRCLNSNHGIKNCRTKFKCFR